MPQIRIIAGAFRGRKLTVLDSPGLRPTTDQARETLFNWLMPYIQGARCLDLFAGSGALSFEALSRGAREVVVLDRSKKICDHLQQEAARIGVVNLKIICCDAIAWLDRAASDESAFDVVFIDPPFQQQTLLFKALEGLCHHNRVASGGLIYVETEPDTQIKVPEQWTLLKEKSRGNVRMRLLQSGELQSRG